MVTMKGGVGYPAEELTDIVVAPDELIAADKVVGVKPIELFDIAIFLEVT
jgi:hypothetical protein